jgi:hypothetical protein
VDENNADGEEGETAFYAGMICNDAGNGVEIGVFVDDECTLYNNVVPYTNFMSDDDQAYYTKAKELVEFMFTNDFDCYNQEIQYTNPYDTAELQEQAENADGEVPEAAEWCRNLFDGDADPVNLYDCGQDENAEEENAEEEEDENLQYYDWYNYQLKNEDAQDIQKVCSIVKLMAGEYTTYYKGDNGSLFDYNQNTSTKKKGLGGGAIAAIVIVVVLAAAGAAWAFRGQVKKKNDKKAPLINGSMA